MHLYFNIKPMKRSHKFVVSQEVLSGALESSGQIFRITKVINNNCRTHKFDQDKGCGSSNEEELIFTEEQLQKMTPKQQYSCFQAQAYEIKQLRRKLRKSSQSRGKVLEEEIVTAKETLKNANFELSDQKLMIDNLVKVLRTGAVMPNTLPYDRLCVIVRNSMNLKVESKTGKYISLPGKELAITEKEQRNYVQLPNTSAILGTLIGDMTLNIKEGKEEEQRREIENYLIVQADFLKRMPFAEFVTTLKGAW